MNKHKQETVSEPVTITADAPHLCPKCMTGYGCESVPCAAAYESICKSCKGEASECQQHDGGPGLLEAFEDRLEFGRRA
jgi:hypothetical protein